ncbi:MAG TPA: GNAT family N-acetyltransferase [Chitinophagaceae bacterium]|nr:GNAT family N-acetyltransferase [Chitinophagaceae bacterium]
MHIVFETPRLILSQFTEEDGPLILQLNSHPEVVKYVHERVLTSEEEAKKILLNIILPQYKNNLGRWAIYTKTGNEFIGWCGLKYRPELDEIDLGYRLKKNAWGKGYATEAAKHTLDHAFNNLNLDIITGRAHIENLASIKVLEKIGMQFSMEEVVDDCPVKTYTVRKQHP